MAHYAVVDDFRPAMPQTTLPAPLAPRGISCHTTEGADGEAGALGSIQYLLDNLARNASYHEVWYAKLDGFEARRIVRPTRASHSMNPAQPPWNPNTRVRTILGDRWYDPNAWSYAVSIAGTTAVTVASLVKNLGFMAGARRRVAEIRAQFPSLNPDPLFNHGEGQADRSDWGPIMRPAILLAGDDMPITVRPVREQWMTRFSSDGSAGFFYLDGPGVGERKWFTTAERVESYAETTDGYRLIWYADEGGSGTLWMLRAQLVTIPGTRQPPAPNYGLPPAADCTAQVSAARLAGFNDAKGKATAAVGGITP